MPTQDTKIELSPGRFVKLICLPDGTYAVAVSMEDVNFSGEINVDNVLAAGENHIGTVTGHIIITDLASLTMDANAHLAGEVIADTQAINAAFRIANGRGLVHSLLLYDIDDAGPSLDIYFLDENVSMGTENQNPTITDGNADAILGFVSVSSSDWKDLGGVKIAYKEKLSMPVKAISGTDDLGIAVITQTAYTPSANGISLRLGIIPT